MKVMKMLKVLEISQHDQKISTDMTFTECL